MGTTVKNEESSVSPLVTYLGNLLLESSSTYSHQNGTPWEAPFPSLPCSSSNLKSKQESSVKVPIPAPSVPVEPLQRLPSFALVMDNARAHTKEAWVHHLYQLQEQQKQQLQQRGQPQRQSLPPQIPTHNVSPSVIRGRVASCPDMMMMMVASTMAAETAGNTPAHGSGAGGGGVANRGMFMSRVSSTGSLCRWDSSGAEAAAKKTKADFGVRKPQRRSGDLVLLEDESTSTSTDHHHDDMVYHQRNYQRADQDDSDNDFGEFCLLSDDENDDEDGETDDDGNIKQNNRGTGFLPSSPAGTASSPFLQNPALRWQ